LFGSPGARKKVILLEIFLVTPSRAIRLTKYKNFVIMAVINSRDNDVSADRHSSSELPSPLDDP